MSAPKTPSKFLSLEFLRELQKNYYLSPCGKEYNEFEVDRLIIEKLTESGERFARRFYLNLEKSATTKGNSAQSVPF